MGTSDIRKDLRIAIDGQPWVVTDFQFVKSPKGKSYTRVKVRNMVTGAMLDRTYTSGETLEAADVEERQLQYVYPEGEDFVFIDAATSARFTAPGDKIGDDSRWLSDGMNIAVTFFKDQPIGVSLPPSAVLQVVNSEPGAKGGATKPATLSTGAVINVPPFVQEGEWVKVDTHNGTYLERVNRR